jgi:hypothetical protein
MLFNDILLLQQVETNSIKKVNNTFSCSKYIVFIWDLMNISLKLQTIAMQFSG